jgi:hypothetical protein
MYEMLEVAVPYYEIVSTNEVVQSVLNGVQLKRPTKNPPSDELWTIMQSCWNEAEERPTFEQIHNQLTPLIHIDSVQYERSPSTFKDGYETTKA